MRTAVEKKKAKRERAFFRAVLSLATEEECERFFADVTTPAELKSLSERFEVAMLLDEGKLSYRDIHEATGVSTTTITRVARFLAQEPNRGYRLVLDRLASSSRKRRTR